MADVESAAEDDGVRPEETLAAARRAERSKQIPLFGHGLDE